MKWSVCRQSESSTTVFTVLGATETTEMISAISGNVIASVRLKWSDGMQKMLHLTDKILEMPPSVFEL